MNMRNRIAISLLILVLCASVSFSATPPKNNTPMTVLPGMFLSPEQVGAEAGDLIYRKLTEESLGSAGLSSGL